MFLSTENQFYCNALRIILSAGPYLPNISIVYLELKNG